MQPERPKPNRSPASNIHKASLAAQGCCVGEIGCELAASNAVGAISDFSRSSFVRHERTPSFAELSYSLLFDSVAAAPT